jgi:hypothetical protein
MEISIFLEIPPSLNGSMCAAVDLLYKKILITRYKRILHNYSLLEKEGGWEEIFQ